MLLMFTYINTAQYKYVCDTRISKKLSKNAESLHHSNTCKIQTKNNNVALQTSNSQLLLNITPRGVNNDDKVAAAAGVQGAYCCFCSKGGREERKKLDDDEKNTFLCRQ
jgi:hypothetical protein